MKRTSIKSVVAQVAMILDDRFWNDAVILENATRAYRQMNLTDKWEAKIAEIELVDHKATLPADYKEIIQIAYRDNLINTTFPSSRSSWQAMRLSTNTSFQTNCDIGCNTTCPDGVTCNVCTSCPQEYSISSNGVITSSVRNGTLLISYFAYPLDEHGDHLIPDDESLKEAIFHYILYRYWLQKDLMKESGADKRMQFHLQMWGVLKNKALNLNLPNLGQLENIRASRSKLVPDSHAFDSFFGSIGSNQFTSF